MIKTLTKDMLVAVSRRRHHRSFPKDFLGCHSLASPLGQREVKREPWVGAEVAVCALAVRRKGCRVDRQMFVG